jgi:hypothetical protein
VGYMAFRPFNSEFKALLRSENPGPREADKFGDSA